MLLLVGRLLISATDVLCVCVRRLRHPNIILLLGVCQTDRLDGLVLIYERISRGSLHNLLYHTVK